MNSKHFEDNRALWELKTPYHVVSEFYDKGSFLEGKSTLTEIERAQVGPVKGLKLLHLQCHFGLDTLSWAKEGARCVGLDFSPAAVQQAATLSTQAGIPCDFRCGNVLDFVPEWKDSFDRAVTSYGVLCWLNALSAWALNISRYLKPGGYFSLVEFHPLLNLFSPELSPCGRYSFTEEPVSRARSGTYANRNAPINYTEHVWGHNIGEIVSALTAAGLTVTQLTEYPYSSFPFHPDMKETDEGWTLLQNGEALPVLLGIVAKK